MGKIKFYLMAIVSVLLAMAGLYRHAEKIGRHAEQKKQHAKINNSIKEARKIESEISSSSPDSIRERMRQHWTRS